MKLNLLKCTFAIELGKFLGYVVSKKGIEVNPNKVQAVQQMESPKSVKDVQCLMGHLAALHRVIAKSGQLIGWAIELSEYDLKFQPRTTIKGQALADFLVECYLTIVEETTPSYPVWALYVDGVVNVDGLGLASELKAQSIRVFSDSQLVVNQIDKIPRANNRQADELSKLASSQDINPQRTTFISYVRKCPTCQFNADDIHMLGEMLSSLPSPWPFGQWGIDMLGPFVKELANKIILHGLKTHVLVAHSNWVDELNKALWSCRTTPRLTTGKTPFCLAYGVEAVVPVQINLSPNGSAQHNNSNNEQLLRENLDLVKEVKEISWMKNVAYQSRVIRFYNKRVHACQFQVDDLVLRRAELTNAYSHMGKLVPNWEGPYMVICMKQPGSCLLTDLQGSSARSKPFPYQLMPSLHIPQSDQPHPSPSESHFLVLLELSLAPPSARSLCWPTHQLDSQLTQLSWSSRSFASS
ncbi:hypothetical protein SLEP1_g31266 [Rubroshorea leprosula]|uniref:Uncharacterized protein n=1 Tax=Rubroshorea leprosula TaxID=152421 RepID=A0AAV5K9L6_9ROSI|nr:hypothetical protein SLEP1_g31266 [Rubroshorea leprosula]